MSVRHVRTILLTLPLTIATIVAVSACDDAAQDAAKGDDDAAKAEGADDPAPGKDDDESESKSKSKSKSKKDRGDASAKMGDTAWTAESASARIKGDRLKLSISRMDMSDGKASRDAFELIVPGYAGPGDYKTQMGSMFVGVGFNTDELKDAKTDDGKTDDAKATKAALDAIQKASTIMLQNMDVHIESDADDQITGTFEAPNSRPPVTEGKFRAIVKKRE